MLPGEGVTIRLINDMDLPNDQLKGKMLIDNKTPNPLGCPGEGGPCGQPNMTPGCDDIDCCRRVCTIDPSCCAVAWDETCVLQATQFQQCKTNPAAPNPETATSPTQ